MAAFKREMSYDERLQLAKKETIRKHYEQLLDAINVDDLTPLLYQEKVIPSENCMDNITSQKNRKHCNEQLLRQIRSSDNPDAMPLFISILKQKCHENIANKMSVTWDDMKIAHGALDEYTHQNDSRGSLEDHVSEASASTTILKQPYNAATPEHPSHEASFGASSESMQDSRERSGETEVKRLSGGSSVSFGYNMSGAEFNPGISSLDEVDCVDGRNPVHKEDRQQPLLLIKTVTLKKDKKGYGFHVMDGKYRERHTGDDEFYITHLSPELQEKTDVIQSKDTIISLNGCPVQGLSKREVKQLISRGNELQLELCSYEPRG